MNGLVRVLRPFVRKLLQVVGNDAAGHRALSLGNAQGAVEQVAHLAGIGGLLYVGAGHILKQGHPIDFLLFNGYQ